MTKTLAIDCMGGDYGPSVIIPAALKALEIHSDITIYLVGHQEQVKKQVSQLNPQA
ncbi:MAG: phosphate acyltransferase, partial [Kangiella sp.]|nr:phosphate acyltransferase [Kangiella sp.]